MLGVIDLMADRADFFLQRQIQIISELKLVLKLTFDYLKIKLSF